VRRSVRAWIRPCAGLLAVAVALTLAAPPAWAGEAKSPAAPQTLRTATAVKVAAIDTNKALRLSADAAGGGGSGDSKGFFRTPKGVATLVLMAGAMTWLLVSRSRDAIHSPAR
jgi:hypothetical protein